MQGESYVAVIFTNQRTGDDDDGYLAAAAHMDRLASEQPGYLGIDSVRSPSGEGITVSYWADDAAARAWKEHADHLVAQQRGRTTWYDRYSVRVATVGREYHHVRPIFHLALPRDWEAAETAGVYEMSTRGITLEQEGFVHCSLAHQVEGVARRFYSDLDELVVLHLDRDSLAAELRFEPPAEGVDELFPHLYGPIPLAAVTDTSIWIRADDQLWHRPAGI